MKRHFPIILSVAVIGLASQGMTAEKDLSTLTCKDVAGMSAAKTVGVALWVSGYLHGKAGNPTVDGDKMEANAEKIADYCRTNADATLASAIKSLSM